MMYIKPLAEIVNIENEDIIVASHSSSVCLKSGDIEKDNDYDLMRANGYCTAFSGSLTGCQIRQASMVCTANEAGGTRGVCTFFGAIDSKCKVDAGAN